MGNNKMKAINDTAMSTNNFIILLYICLHRSPSMVTEMPLLTILLSNLLYSVRMAFHISFWSSRPRTIGRAFIFIFLANAMSSTILIIASYTARLFFGVKIGNEPCRERDC